MNHALAAGHAYGYTYYSAAWAPRASLAEIRTNAIDYTPPSFADPDGNGFQASAKYALLR